MLMIFLFITVFFSRDVFHRVVKYAYNQIIDLCYRKAKTVKAPISNFLSPTFI